MKTSSATWMRVVVCLAAAFCMRSLALSLEDLKDFRADGLVRFQSLEEAECRRAALTRFIWPDGLPKTVPLRETESEFPAEVSTVNPSLIRQVDRLEVSIGHAHFRSIAYHLFPFASSNPPRVALLHAGHVPEGRDQYLSGGLRETAEVLLGDGYEVVLFQMPLTGWNRDSEGWMEEVGGAFFLTRRGTAGHRQLFDLLEPRLGGGCFAFFLEPLVQVVNELTNHRPETRVVMVGLSGGGWTTHMAAAVDPRIMVSIPVAGALPLYAREMSPGSMGDTEQYYPPLYREEDGPDTDLIPDKAAGVASWLEIFALGAIGEGRKQVQVLNYADPCCFSGPVYETYSTFLETKVKDLTGGKGVWEVYSDRSHQGHLISNEVLQKVVKPVLSQVIGGGGVQWTPLEDRRELFVDDALMGGMSGGVQRMLHAPRAEEIVLTMEEPWEGIYSAYFTVLQYDGKYRMYYRGMPEAKHDLNTEVTCYAESEDGLNWRKPELGFYEVKGTRKNNVILARHRGCHNFSPFVDERPGVNPDERFKALGGTGQPGLIAFASPDGLRWKELQAEPVIRDGAFDSQNVAFWSQTEQCYVCYFRVFHEGVRWIARSTSKDFQQWSDPVRMEVGEEPMQHLYTNQIAPYYRAPHLYIGFPTRFMPGRRALSQEVLERLGADRGFDFRKDCADIMMISTRGGSVLNRGFMEGFIRPGLDVHNWTSRANYAAYGLLGISDTEMAMYVNHNLGYPSSHIRRYTMRVDGMVSLRGSFRGGEAWTQWISFKGTELRLNYSTSAAGGIKVGIEDVDGREIPGFGLDQCLEIIGDEIDRKVFWSGGGDLSALEGRPIRLRFRISDGDLYSYHFTSQKD